MPQWRRDLFDVTAAAHLRLRSGHPHLQPPAALSQVPADLLPHDHQAKFLPQPALRVACRAPPARLQFGPEALPLLGSKAGRLAALGSIGVTKEFLDASLPEPANPLAKCAAGGAHDLRDPAVSLLAFQGQANGLESLALPRDTFYCLLFKDLRGLVVHVYRSAGSWRPPYPRNCA